MLDATLLDVLFTVGACISAGFLVYGGWLCLRREPAPSAEDAVAPSEHLRPDSFA